MSFSLCTVLHDGVEPYLDEFVTSLVCILEEYDVQSFNVIVICDGSKHLKSKLEPLEKFNLIFEYSLSDAGSVASVRQQLMSTARQSGYEYLIFIDSDDLAQECLIDEHLNALSDCDFSYSDQILIDVNGQMTGRNLFDGYDIPAVTNSIQQLLGGNYIGLSALAFRKKILDENDFLIPDNISAVDWWLSSMFVYYGYTGRKTERAVVRYRQYCSRPLADDMTVLLKQLDTVISHFKAIGQYVDMHVLISQLQKFRASIKKDKRLNPENEGNSMKEIYPWYSNIILQSKALTSSAE